MLKLKRTGIFTCLLLIFVLLGCKDLKNSAEVKQIDSLKNVLSTVNSKIAEIDSQRVSKIYVDFQNNSKQLGIYFNDKKENGVWECITQYDIINMPLTDFINNRSYYVNQVENSNKQLENLRSDYINRTITKEKFLVFFNQESALINKLSLTVASSVNQTKEVIAIFDTLNPKVLILIEKLKEEKNKLNKNK